MKLLRKILILVILIYVLTGIFRVQDIIMERLYPTPYSEYVDKFSEQYNIDKYLIYSIMKTESKFKEDAVSKSSAKGLMQLMENTAVELAEEEGIAYTKDSTIFDVETNIKLGTKYISKLLTYYDGNIMLAVTAYNAGIGNVNKWIEEKTILEGGTDVENIPFKETSMYVRKIFREYKIYFIRNRHPTDGVGR